MARVDLISVLPAFVLAVLAISAVPGPAVALILRRATVHGGRAAVPLVLGLEAGLFLWALAAALGLAALVAVSQVAYTVLRVGGAAVLVVLGLLALRAAWVARHPTSGPRLTDGDAEAGGEPDGLKGHAGALRPLRAHRAFAEGLVTNLANPKAAIFMVAFFPQFIPHGYPVLPTTVALATVQVSVETALYCGLAYGVGRIARLIARSSVRAAIDTVSGTVLIALGLRVATTARAL